MAVLNRDKVLLFQRIVPHYRIPVFNRLKHELNVHVCYSSEKKGALISSATMSDNFPGERVCRTYFLNKETCVIQNVIKPLLKYRPKIVISEFSIGYLSFWALLFLKVIFRFKLIAWSHGINNDEILKPFSSWKSKLLLSVLGVVDGLILYSSVRKKMIEEKVGEKSKLFLAQNTLAIDGLIKSQEKLALYGRKALHEELSFKERYHLIYIGRLLKEKRIDLLLDVFSDISSEHDIALHIIGSGPELKIIEEYRDLHSFYYHGAIFDDVQISKYLFASDIFLNPGVVGLSIVNAFSHGKPLITCKTTSKGPFHGPEFEYLESGKNGIICDSTVESIKGALSQLLNDTNLLAKLSSGALETAKTRCSIDKMVAGFRNAINTVSTER